MTPEAQATARALVEDPRWTGERFDALPEPEIDDAWFHTDRGIRWVWEGGEWLPDLDDDATGGVILGMLIDVESDGIEVWIPRRGAYSSGVRVDGEDGESLAHAAALAWLATAR